MAVRNIVRQWNEASQGYSYRFKGGDIFLRLVKAEECYELRNPIGYGVQVVKCKDLDEAFALALLYEAVKRGVNKKKYNKMISA